MTKLNRSSLALILLCGLFVAIPMMHKVAVAGAKQKQSLSSKSPKTTTPTARTFSSTANGGTKVVVSTGGNITGFASPNGYEHIGNGALSEGYVLCYNATNAYDTGSNSSGFGAPTVLSSSPSALSISRNTSDGILNLLQKFDFNVSKGQNIGVSMTVKNLSGVTVNNVILRRQVDFDIDTGGTRAWANFNNRFAKTSTDGVFAWNDPSDAPAGFAAHGILLRTDGNLSVVVPKVTSDILDTSCSPTVVATTPTLPTDIGATLEYNLGSIPAGGQKVVQSRYVRF